MASDKCLTRMKRLQDDVEVIKLAFDGYTNCPFVNFNYDDFVLSFEHQTLKTRDVYNINVSEDYPNGSILAIESGDSGECEMNSLDVPLPVIIHTIAQKHSYTEFSVLLTGDQRVVSPVVKPVAVGNGDNSDDYEKEVEDKEEKGVEEEEDNNEDIQEDEEEDDDEEVDGAESGEYCDNGDSNVVMFTINPQFAADLERLEMLSIVQFQTIPLPEINEYLVIVSLSTEFLDEESAAAWNLKYREPVTMRLTLNLSKYMDEPRKNLDVIVAEGTSCTSCSVSVQFKNIMKTFLLKSSQLVTNDIIKKKFQSVVDCEQTQLPFSTENPGLENGFLVQFVKYADLRLRTLNEFCVVCDDRQVLSNMLKPTVCSSELCAFSFQTFGFMTNAADYIKSQREVFDLLITMARAARTSHRRELIFNTFPTIFDRIVFVLNPKFPDYVKVSKPFEILAGPQFHVSLEKKLHDRDPSIYLPLQWIITNNRSHITKLEPKRQLDFMITNHQYIMRTSSPAKEAAFAEARKKFGSTFAFYGSSMENWHSIFSNGLMNASGTEHQVKEAMYGDGIYLSPSASTSLNYSGLSENLDNQRLYCIALCEVIKSEDLVKEPYIWVVANPDHVMTRFFFVYKKSIEDLSAINTESEDIRKKIVLAYSHGRV